ncbi:MAG: prepilin-type N-terminal cleavage/methylation domain-containing protein [Terriglobales bacterium]|jgi:type II secretory pathway pseudopilin PulG
MSERATKRESGFSLLEMTIAVALGTLVLGAAVQLYTQAVGATWTVSQRAELQQDFRAASDMLTKDLSLAGAGLGNGAAIPLPSKITPEYGCDQTSACYLGGSNTSPGTYPLQGATPTLYGLIPGYTLGPTLSSNPNATDVVTVVYSDTTFYLNCYQATVSALGQVTFGPATAPVNGVVPTFPPTNCLPSGVTTPQAVNDTMVGLTPGDLVLMTLNGIQVVGEVTAGTITTGTNAVGTTYIVPFANSDVLNMNQTGTGATAGLNGAALHATGANPVRLLVITYYIDKTVTPARLMRQISGHTPMPVADGIAYMKFSYDLYNDNTNLPAVNQPNPGSGDANDSASNGLNPTDITKINILHMAMNSALHGASGYQGLDLETSVSARDLTYSNKYPILP